MKLTVKQAAVRAGVSESLVYEWCRARHLAHFRFGVRGRGRVMIDEGELDRFLGSCHVEAEEEDDDQVFSRHKR
jgi:excisionase family DNA binding protein